MAAEKRAEMIGVSAFMSIYVFILLGALYAGTTEFLNLVFYSIVTLFSIILLIMMSAKLDIPMFKLDFKVAVSTLVATILMLIFVALPQTGGFVRAQMAVLSISPTVMNILTTLLFVALAESLFKFVVVQGLIAGGLHWTPSCMITAFVFAILHSFRYGFAWGPMAYLFVMGFILLGMGRLPKLLGSDVELSVFPVVFAHMMHNVAIPAASLLILGVLGV